MCSGCTVYCVCGGVLLLCALYWWLCTTRGDCECVQLSCIMSTKYYAARVGLRNPHGVPRANIWLTNVKGEEGGGKRGLHSPPPPPPPSHAQAAAHSQTPSVCRGRSVQQRQHGYPSIPTTASPEENRGQRQGPGEGGGRAAHLSHSAGDVGASKESSLRCTPR